MCNRTTPARRVLRPGTAGHWLMAAVLACVVGCSGGTNTAGSVPTTPPPSPAPAPDPAPPPAPPPTTGSGTLTLAWDTPSTEGGQVCPRDIAGYRLYRGAAAGVYTNNQMLPANLVTCTATGQTDACGATRSCTFTLQGLPSGTWHFAVTAYDSTGTESLASNNFTYTVP